MGRPQLGPRERLRVELRLSPEIAEMLYDSAQQWNVSLSEAGARLIQLGYGHNEDGPKRTT
jgi:hypothetical protein